MGTGFDSGIGNPDFVWKFGATLVGGFVHNDTGITITGVRVQAICAILPPGATAASSRNRNKDFKAFLARRAKALAAH